MVFMELLHQAEKPRHGSRPADSSEALSGADEVTPRLDRELVAMTANAMEQDRHRCMDAGTAARTYDEGRLRNIGATLAQDRAATLEAAIRAVRSKSKNCWTNWRPRSASSCTLSPAGCRRRKSMPDVRAGAIHLARIGNPITRRWGVHGVMGIAHGAFS
jgi:hypothetical protein